MTHPALAKAPIFAEAQCANVSFPDLFFPESKQELKDVKPMIDKTCRLCIHQVECLSFALNNEIKEGIWGGLTPDERKELKAQQAKILRREQRRFERLQAKATKHNTTKIKGTK